MLWYMRLVRQPNAVLGTLTGGFNMLILFNVLHWNTEQTASVNVFAALLFGLVALVVTPSNEVVAQQRDPNGPVVATRQAESQFGIRKGRTVSVDMAPALDPDDPPTAP